MDHEKKIEECKLGVGKVEGSRNNASTLLWRYMYMNGMTSLLSIPTETNALLDQVW